MAITLTCPRCTHRQTIDEEKADKEIRCKICFHTIDVKTPTPKADAKTSTATTAKPPAATPVNAKLASKEHDGEGAESEGVQTGPPPVKTGPAGKRRADNDDADDRDERSASRNRKRRQESSSGMLWLAIAGGGALVLLLLVCGGVGLGLLFFRAGAKPENPQIVHGAVDEPAHEDPVPALPVNPPVMPFPPPIPFPNQPFQPNPFPPNPIVPVENLNPGNPNEIARVLQLLQGPPQARGPAFSWLSNADPDHPRRGEVAKQMETMVDEQLKVPFANNTFFAAYFRWATRDNVPSLIRLAENEAFTPWDNERRQKSMQALAKMKEVGGASAMARRLGNAFDGQAAASALREMGPIAQPAVMTYMNHPNGNVRNAARNVLQSYKTPASAHATQCIADLGSGEQARRGAAVAWLGQNPADPAQKTAVSQALNQAIDNEGSFSSPHLAQALENWGTAANVAKLVPILDGARLRRGDVVRILGKIRDPNGIDAIARRLNNFFDRDEVQKALRDAGPLAEPAVLKAMQTTTDGNMRLACVRFLGEIGSRNASLPVLAQLPQRFPQDRNLAITVQASMNAINKRP